MRLTGGINDHFTPQELVSFVLDEEPLFEPGEGFAYNDTGYILLGMIIEKATGKPYYDVLSDRILKPHDLFDTIPATTLSTEHLAAGYVAPQLLTVVTGLVGKTIDEKGKLRFHPGSEWTGGGLYNTPTMLVRFYTAVADGQIVSPEYFDAMRESGHRASDGYHYGFGLYIRPESTFGPIINHGGWYPGYSNVVAHFVEHRITIALQTNTDGNQVELYGPLSDIARLWLQQNQNPPSSPDA
jgi:D-alanyl-D-alanine carboxypeptidase